MIAAAFIVFLARGHGQKARAEIAYTWQR